MAALFLLTAGCGRAHFQCDDQGYAIPANASPEARVEAGQRNVDLAERRVRYSMGRRWINPAKLAKADGCP